MVNGREKEVFKAVADANEVKEAEAAAGAGCVLFLVLAFATWFFIDQTWYNYLFWGAAFFGLGSVFAFFRASRLKKKYRK